MSTVNPIIGPRAFAACLAAIIAFAAAAASPAGAQTAAEAAQDMANLLDGAGGGVSSDELLAALESAAEAGQPIALWRLGVMYENGEGVKKDEVKAFGYFSRIANDNANTPPRSLEADIVAQSFVKVGDYYRKGLPDAGIKANSKLSHGMLMHAAQYFGDPDAQYRVGMLYLNEEDGNPILGARWLASAAGKGHVAAQAALGDLLFNGRGVEAQPVDGLMWLTVAHSRSLGTLEEDAISELLNKAMSVATPAQRTAAVEAADKLGKSFAGL